MVVAVGVAVATAASGGSSNSNMSRQKNGCTNLIEIRKLPRTFRETSAKTTGRFSDAVLPRGSSADVFVLSASAALPRKGCLVFGVIRPKPKHTLSANLFKRVGLGLALEGSHPRRSCGNLFKGSAGLVVQGSSQRRSLGNWYCGKEGVAKYSQTHPVASAELLRSFREIPLTSLVPGAQSREGISVVALLLPKQKTTLLKKCVGFTNCGISSTLPRIC